MRKELLSILLLSVLVASTLVGCSQPCTLTILSITGGSVSVMRAGTDDWIEAEVGMSLGVGDSIETGNDSSAEITFIDGSTIELQAGTEIEVDSLATTDTDSSTIVVKQTIGSIIFRVTKIVDPASRYEVETPAGVVAVRGSIMQVYVTEDGTTRATNLEGDIWAVAQGVELQVPEGRQCIIRPDEPPELEVTFADPNLEAAVRDAIAIPTGPISVSDLGELTHLYASAKNITDLTGLESATSLTHLELDHNQISDISPLANLTDLTGLYLWGNQISDISPLANLIDLTALSLGSNQISDISVLVNFTDLIFLILEDNQVSDISLLANLTSLTYLHLGGNQINDISPVADLTNLTQLSLGGNQISDISDLANLSSLTLLLLSPNQISDISPLVNLANLTTLSLGSNQISDISPVANLTSLTYLQLYFNQISDISPLVNLTNLTQLNLVSNQISDVLPLVENQGISEGDEVYLGGNPLSSDSVNIYIAELEARGVTVYY